MQAASRRQRDSRAKRRNIDGNPGKGEAASLTQQHPRLAPEVHKREAESAENADLATIGALPPPPGDGSPERGSVLLMIVGDACDLLLRA
ncbi:hypothetical protein GCM10027514_20790 [Azotobacter armeniacus]